MTTKQISVFLENKPGELSDFCNVLREHNVDMRALSVADTQNFGIVRVIVDDVYKTMTVLREEDYVCRVADVLTLEMRDEPGALSEILNILNENYVNVEYMYAFLTRQRDKAYVVVKIEDPISVGKILTSKGVRVICQDDMEKIFKN